MARKKRETVIVFSSHSDDFVIGAQSEATAGAQAGAAYLIYGR